MAVPSRTMKRQRKGSLASARRKSQENPQGKIAEREGTIHVSNLMLQSRYDSSKRAKQPAAAAAKKA